ncbi:hypothetical protein PHYPSEUDO_001266 [Phytophthora pseudosyringae]|uniref:Uncharacterized protein n=1 Tax=Phytophthora pseudosyringae TaxID=221518 RepID=A0A8T1W0X9_9STRA|nr:hypothetical protein PHYPSEUDO_001266 [Phytophthora pseudosyringae]
MLTKQDMDRLKSQVEFAMEVLLRAADERVSWKQPGDSPSPETPIYAFLPGVYTSEPPHAAPPQPQHQEDSAHDAAKVAPLKTAVSTRSAISQPPTPVVAAPENGVGEGDGSRTRVVLHGDNSFEYVWTMRRSGARAMEFTVEMEGGWTKPELNRTRRGEEDQRVFLSAKRIRFQRLSNYGRLLSFQEGYPLWLSYLLAVVVVPADTENQTWKLCLRTLTRHGSDWASVGLTERGVPPIVMVFQCVDGRLESTGAALPAQILSNSPACRILAGLTKKIANKLGAPVDVMTEKWLPARGVRLTSSADTGGVNVKQFNPFYCLADALRSGRHSSEATASPRPLQLAIEGHWKSTVVRHSCQFINAFLENLDEPEFVHVISREEDAVLMYAGHNLEQQCPVTADHCGEVYASVPTEGNVLPFRLLAAQLPGASWRHDASHSHW